MRCTQASPMLANVSADQSVRLIGAVQSWDWTGH